jgi:hypothetical protein
MKGELEMPKGVYIKSEEHKINMKKARANYHKNHKGNRYGQKLSEETKQIRRLINKNKIRKPHIVKLLSEETKRKISLSQKGKYLSKETKEKIRESCKNAIIVHHINGNHFDDRPENRMLVTPKEHAQIHIMQGDIRPYGYRISNNQLKAKAGGKRNE